MAIAEGPSNEVALAQLFGLGMAGHIQTMTMKAFEVEEFGAILKQLP